MEILKLGWNRSNPNVRDAQYECRQINPHGFENAACERVPGLEDDVELRSPEGSSIRLVAINNLDQIALQDSHGKGNTWFLYDIAKDQFTPIGMRGNLSTANEVKTIQLHHIDGLNDQSEIIAEANSGWVFGTAVLGDHALFTGFIYGDGSIQSPVAPDAIITSAMGINNHRVITGFYQPQKTSLSRSFIFDGKTFTDLPVRFNPNGGLPAVIWPATFPGHPAIQ